MVLYFGLRPLLFCCGECRMILYDEGRDDDDTMFIKMTNDDVYDDD